jgi:hypothetical protein
MGRTHKQATSSRTKKKRNQTHSTNTRTDVGRLMGTLITFAILIGTFIGLFAITMKE